MVRVAGVGGGMRVGLEMVGGRACEFVGGRIAGTQMPRSHSASLTPSASAASPMISG